MDERFEDYVDCRLCPRQCGVDRGAGRQGVCRETAVCRVASIGPHFGEEPCFSGTRGSGTIFFSGCSSRCLFCQNFQISMGNEGAPLSMDELERQARRLVERGVHNLNFVTPDHFWPHIRELCRRLRAGGITPPFLFNSSGYQDPDRVDDYARWIDIFLPDFKFADPALAQTCMGDRRYPEIALKALIRMVEARGFLTPWSTDGEMTAREGVLVRHLVLPGQVENSLKVLDLLHANFGQRLPLSVMSQFQPIPNCFERNLFTQPLSSADYRLVCDRVESLGFEHVFIQPDMGDPDFLPDFTQERPFKGNG